MFFYASAQVFSRYLKDLEVTLTNAVMGLVGFVLLIISSSIFEGQTINEIKNISFQSWLLILHSGIFVSIAAPPFTCEKKHIDEIIEKLRTGISNYMHDR